MSEALSKEKNIYYSTLQNTYADFKISHPFKSTNILCKLFKAIISLRRSEKFPSLFRVSTTGTVEHPSYSILCLCPNVHRHSFFSHFEVTHIRSNRHQQRFPEVYLIQKFAHTEKLQYHRSNPTIYELLRIEPHDPSYYDLQDRRSLPCQQSIENHCPSPI